MAAFVPSGKAFNTPDLGRTLVVLVRFLRCFIKLNSSSILILDRSLTHRYSD